MKHMIPHTPFTAHLSGSAKKTELRLRNIFQWKKKHPPAILLLAAILFVSGCGDLVHFGNTTEQESVSPEIRMDVQYYDASGGLFDILEIPTLVMPDEEAADDGVNAINLALSDFKEQYQSSDFTQCVLYPTETDRYINLLFFQTCLYTDLNTGHVFSLVYDKEEKRQVTMEDALALAGVTEQELYGALSAQYDPQLALQLPDAHIIIQNQALEGFRMDDGGHPIFYLTARSDDADDSIEDYISGADNLYIWSDGQFTVYEQYQIIMNDPYGVQPLVPLKETVELDPPLWCQWYFSGGEPEGGLAAPENTPVWEPVEDQEDDTPPSATPVPADVSSSPNQTHETQTTAQSAKKLTVMEAYQAVLQGNIEFRDTLSGENFDISRVREVVTPDTSLKIQPNYFSVVDLDADGTVEVILSLDVNGNGPGYYLVLRHQDDIVYGYLFAVQEFNDIKADGTFWQTGGASDVGICRITFDRDTYSIDRFTYSLYSPSAAGDGMSYFVDHQATTREEYEQACGKWQETSSVVWYKLTDDNIEAILSS